MRRVKRVIVLLLVVMLCMPLLTGVQTEAADGGKHLDVLFTHDTHSHLNSYSTIVNGKQKEVGGFARLKTLIDEKKKENPDTLILDGGDFSMGTLIQTVYTTEAAELRMLGYLGCDVTTFGNHEFDYRSDGLADMLKTAKNSEETVPELVVCNVDWDAMEKEGLSNGQKQIESAFETYGVKDYVVIQKGERLFAYEYNGYWKDVGTLGSYWEANMELIDIIPEFNLYEEFWKIYTNSEILPPQYISAQSVIERSIICNGAEVYGEVHNSIIGSGVIIGEGSVIKDSIIMKDARIGKNCVVDKAIIAENCVVGDNVTFGIGSDVPNKLKPAIYSFGLVAVGEKSVIPDGVQIGKNTAVSGVTSKEDYPDGVLESGETLIKAGGQA